jgi:hypothetical protein
MGCFEALAADATENFLLNFVRKGNIVLDVGANIGQSALPDALPRNHPNANALSAASPFRARLYYTGLSHRLAVRTDLDSSQDCRCRRTCNY